MFKERSGQHAAVKPELFLWGGACIDLDLDDTVIK